MNKTSFLWLVVAFVAAQGVARAEELSGPVNENKEKLEAPAGSTNKVPGAEAVDDILTNANLRALSGSTSRWSIASSFTYDGGTIASPLAEKRPNIAEASGNSPDTDINGQLNVKYNINTQNALLFGFGVRKMAPFVSTGPSSEFYSKGGKDMDFFDPSATYQYIYKMGVVQAVLQVGMTQYTRRDIASAAGQNLAQNLSFDQENIIDIGDTGLSIGGSLGFGGNTPTDGGQDYSRYQYWFSPYLEYKLSDKVNFRTVSNLWVYEYYPQEHWFHDTVTQSVGLGFSITRDIFLYPNIQFLPDHIVADLTNVGLSATINLF